MIKVSVIIPVYKVEQYIERCARSLFGQSLNEMEFIFVDDCSPDNSMQIVEQVLSQYPHRRLQTRFVKHDLNRGLTCARNTGLAVAKGQYIAHCDSDDWVSPNMYKTLLMKAEESAADVAYCDFIAVYKDKSIEYHCAKLLNDKGDYLRYYMTHGWTSVWNLIAKRNLYSEHGLVSPENFTYCEDFYLSVKLMFHAKKIVKLDEPLYYYNRLNTSSLLNTTTDKSISDEILCYTGLIDFFNERGCIDDYIKELSWKILKCKQDWVLNSQKHNDFSAAGSLAHNYIWSCPFLNLKMKIMMWMLCHNMRGIVVCLIKLRQLF